MTRIAYVSVKTSGLPNDNRFFLTQLAACYLPDAHSEPVWFEGLIKPPPEYAAYTSPPGHAMKGIELGDIPWAKLQEKGGEERAVLADFLVWCETEQITHLCTWNLPFWLKVTRKARGAVYASGVKLGKVDVQTRATAVMAVEGAAGEPFESGDYPLVPIHSTTYRTGAVEFFKVSTILNHLQPGGATATAVSTALIAKALMERKAAKIADEILSAGVDR